MREFYLRFLNDLYGFADRGGHYENRQCRSNYIVDVARRNVVRADCGSQYAQNDDDLNKRCANNYYYRQNYPGNAEGQQEKRADNTGDIIHDPSSFRFWSHQDPPGRSLYGSEPK